MSMKPGCNKYGIINDSPYPVTKHFKRKKIWTCPIYSLWYDMWCRVSDPILYPSYVDCSVAEEWRLFSNFLKWVQKQNWEGRFLDKDLLIEGNKNYSASTCLFVSREVNNFLVKPRIAKDLPLGVTLIERNKKKPYLGQCGSGSGRGYLGYFSSPMSAHLAWQKAKLSRLDQLINKEECDQVKVGLQRIKSKLIFAIQNSLEVKEL